MEMAIEIRLKQIINPLLQVRGLLLIENFSKFWCHEVDKISLTISTFIIMFNESEISCLEDINNVKSGFMELSNLLHKYIWIRLMGGTMDF